MEKVLSIIKTIQKVSGEAPCKKTLQKIVYLIQEANEDLGYDYSIHYYGPYSADLDSEIRYQHNCGVIDISVDGYSHRLSVGDFSESVPIENSPTVERIISKFGEKSPSELELLATTLYVQRSISNNHRDEISKGVKRIKGSKYSDEEITESINTLVSNQYF
jgi:uncharacterized protein YwgA